jgi:hypothetical protein
LDIIRRILGVGFKLFFLFGLVLNGWEMPLIVLSDPRLDERVKAAGFMLTFIGLIGVFIEWLRVDLRPAIDIDAIRGGQQLKIGRSRRVPLAMIAAIPTILGLAVAGYLEGKLPPTIALGLLGCAVLVAGLAVYLWTETTPSIALTPIALADEATAARLIPWHTVDGLRITRDRGMVTGIDIQIRDGRIIHLTGIELTVPLFDLRRAIEGLSGIVAA